MVDPYDMRSNLKNKPGAQGTLFQVKDKGLLNPAQRWPQGYTPERLGEVREALKTTPVSAPEHMYDAPDYEVQAQHGTNAFGYRERLHREIAKTTVPPEHLKGFGEITGSPDPGTHGTYFTGGKRAKPELAVDLTEQTPNAARKTLTHEIGHHVNMTLAPTPHVHELVAKIHAHKDIESNEWRDKPNSSDVAFAKSKTSPGVDEAQADDYAVEHYRTGGRKSTGTTKGAYEDNFAPNERAKAYPGYNDVRPPQHPPLQGAQFHTASMLQVTAGGNLRVPGAASGQTSELQRRLAARADATRHAVGDNL